ncbi:sialoadhesin-like [Discoglossus pictus]
MMLSYISMQMILIFLVLQGFFPHSACEEWSFTFPSSIQALKGSCVEIPCLFTSPTDYKEFSLIWYLYRRTNYPEVFNSRDQSNVLADYRGRTSLVRNEPNSCTLRINDVTKEEAYYAGISESINSWHLSVDKVVTVQVTDFPGTPLLTQFGILTEGIPVIISCSAKHTCASNPPSLEWNKDGHNIRVQHEDLTGGYWNILSEINYVPIYQDHKTQLCCTSLYPNGQRKHKGFTLNIKYYPKNTSISIVESKKIKEGDSVTLVCNSHGNPDPDTYMWYKVETTTHVDLQKHNKIITLRNVSWMDEKYVCSAINQVGRGDSPVTEIPVLYSAKDVKIIKGKKQFQEGQEMELVCQFSRSNPKPTHYTWYQDGVLIPDETGQALRWRNISTTHSGNYSCVAHNEVGDSLSLPVNVIVTLGDDMGRYIAAFVVSGILLLTFLMLIIYFSLRKKRVPVVLHSERNSPTQGAKSFEPVYSDLLNRAGVAEYEEFMGKKSSDDTYHELMNQAKLTEFEECPNRIYSPTPVKGEEQDVSTEYENILLKI